MTTPNTNIGAAYSGGESHWAWDNLKVFLGDDQVSEIYYAGAHISSRCNAYQY